MSKKEGNQFLQKKLNQGKLLILKKLQERLQNKSKKLKKK